MSIDSMEILRHLTHYGLHIFFPVVIAKIFFPQNWQRAWLIMIATMIVDLDHLLAYPDLFVKDRCSIGFHPLHTFPAIIIYALLMFFSKFRLVGLGLLLHMISDLLDCFWMKHYSL